MRSLDLDPDSQNRSGSRRTKTTHKKENNYLISFCEVLDVLFKGLKASLVAWTSFMEA
jgi:hypothetical protein